MAKIDKDKYYTPDIVVKKVIEIVEKEIAPIDSFKRIIEPSSGGGAFLKQLPSHTIGYDIEPTYFNDNVITGDFLKQNIEYVENSIVIGNPPFDDGTASNGYFKEFIEKGLEIGDWVVFIVPTPKPIIKNGVVYKKYILPKMKYSGKSLRLYLVIFKKGEAKKIKNVKGVEIKIFEKRKNTTSEEIQAWYNKPCDYRLTIFGRVKIIDNSTMRVNSKEMKITFNEKVNFRNVLDAYIRNLNKYRTLKQHIGIQNIKDMIWDNFPQFRSDDESS